MLPACVTHVIDQLMCFGYLWPKESPLGLSTAREALAPRAQSEPQLQPHRTHSDVYVAQKRRREGHSCVTD